VAIVDERPFGGTCVLRGCDPKKVLVQAAELLDHALRMQGRGAAGPLASDWPALMRFKRTFTEPVPAQREKSFAERGIATFHGHARFISDASVEVGGEVLAAEHVVVATGSRPRDLAFSGAEHVVTSDDFLELEALPSPIVFVGGGYVSFELAHVAARFGAEVHIVHRGERPLEHFEPELVARLVQAGEERGVQVHLRAPVERVERCDSRFHVHAGGRLFEAALVVHGAGRVPNVAGLGLERAHVATAKNGAVLVDEHLRSTANHHVYAAGDVAGTGHPALTPVSSAHGHVVAENILHGARRTVDLTEIPTVVFAIPALAAVGLTEHGAKAKGLRFRVHREDASSWYSTRSLGALHAMAKVLVEEPSQVILGAHLLGPHAAELVNVFALAIRLRLTSEALRATTFAYPTAASDVGYLL
ncbi:MAG TPA: NAD(P)/FAD-dependent oxidoreductase, partial [Polyangiaceae bacterium]